MRALERYSSICRKRDAFIRKVGYREFYWKESLGSQLDSERLSLQREEYYAQCDVLKEQRQARAVNNVKSLALPEFIEEHLERRIQESVQFQLQAQQQFYIPHLNAIADEVVPTRFAGVDRSPQLLMHQRNVVFAESILPTHEASNENLCNAVDDNTPARGFVARSWRGLLVLLLIMVAIVSGVAIGVALQNESSFNPETEPPSTGVTSVPTMSAVDAPSSSPTMSLVELLKPLIVRNDADLALLNDGISPQWRALDWLSTDSIALSENQSPTIILNRYVLAVLYYATSGDDWGQQLGSYLQPTSVCEWNNGNPWRSDNAKGVYCVTQSSVQQVTLNSFGLGGTVPWELSLLESRAHLDLSGNSLTGTCHQSWETCELWKKCVSMEVV